MDYEDFGNNVSSLVDKGWSIDEILSGGMATTDDVENYEDSYRIPQLKTSPKYTGKPGTRDDANYDPEF
jgi:hypothetical protein